MSWWAKDLSSRTGSSRLWSAYLMKCLALMWEEVSRREQRAAEMVLLPGRRGGEGGGMREGEEGTGRNMWSAREGEKRRGEGDGEG